ncbi:MAG: DUF309 domain-containing protein [Halobacteriovoraceae bacterium]|jgi:hypothetical protein|nr:DUF309 domain-containing protein [Halobacteriovoraceae bacterium]MBT5094091.1 DUF309 domain-containing protein [Halobacteriovoraceae bacterium]
MPKRFSQRELPGYRYIPGKFPHPNKEGGHSYGVPELVASLLEVGDPFKNSDFSYGVDLLNMGYYWESHVVFEAFWNAYGRVGNEANFFKALIALGAAGVKQGAGDAVERDAHLLRAQVLLSELPAQVLSLSIVELRSLVESGQWTEGIFLAGRGDQSE